MSAPEEQLIVRAPDGKRIYATLGLPARKTSRVVVFVHGLSSTEVWPPMLLGSWYFRQRGYAYCRPNLYDWRPGARTLMTSDLLQHSRDVDTVVRFLTRRGYSEIYAVGHSFGGLTLLRAETNAFRAMSLWDISSFISYPPRKWFRKDRRTGATYMTGAYELMMSPRYIRGIEAFPDELDLIERLEVPTQICYADGKEALLTESSKRYFARVRSDKELVRIPGASHSFTEEGVSKLLFRRTSEWFRRF